MKTNAQMESFLKSQNYWIDKSISGYYRLFKGEEGNQIDSELIHDDPGEEDMYNYDFALYYFYCLITGEWE